MVVHGSVVVLYLGFLSLVALGERRRVMRSLKSVRSAGPCWISQDK